MSLRNLSWQQVIVIVACLAAAFLAHKFLGEDAGMVSGFVTTLLAFLMGRGGDPPKAGGDGPDLKVIAGGLGVLLVASLTSVGVLGCGAWFQDIDDAELQNVAARLSKCRAEGRDAGSYAAYERCKEREGLKGAADGGAK